MQHISEIGRMLIRNPILAAAVVLFLGVIVSWIIRFIQHSRRISRDGYWATYPTEDANTLYRAGVNRIWGNTTEATKRRGN